MYAGSCISALYSLWDLMITFFALSAAIFQWKTSSCECQWFGLPAELYPHGLETLDITGFLRYSVVMFCGWFYWSVALPVELYPRSWFFPCGFNFLWNKAWLNCWILILFWFLIALFPSFSNSIQVSFLDFKVVQLRRQIKKLGQHWIFITNQGR